jgi:UDP-N-acetylglucosamine--N-acetylmuramyl-(pentapeptide) pyrophosphoryl-undecaprenol N-acetylglucosamine transferase
VGGFASGPFVLASAFLGKPVFLLEQNAVMGFTNRTLLRFAKKIFVAFPLKNIKEADAHKVVLAGNPVRSSIKPSKRYSLSVAQGIGAASLSSGGKTFNIFVFGGSQGARAINNCIISAMALLNNIGSIKIVHQAGKLDFEKVKDAYKGAKFEHSVHDYIHGMDKIYDDTDLVIARSGASTIFELIASRLPSILVPLPTAADDHQYFNARFLSDKGAAEVIEQRTLTPELLAERIKFYKENQSALKEMNKKLEQVPVLKKKAEQIIVEAIAGSVNV